VTYSREGQQGCRENISCVIAGVGAVIYAIGRVGSWSAMQPKRVSRGRSSTSSQQISDGMMAATWRAATRCMMLQLLAP
jgi:hypothetical protein